MDFMELISERFSVRSFSQRPVEDEKIDLILKAAQLAPTAVNYQPQKIYILTKSVPYVPQHIMHH